MFEGVEKIWIPDICCECGQETGDGEWENVQSDIEIEIYEYYDYMVMNFAVKKLREEL